MQLVAKRKDGSLFRAITVLEADIEAEKQIMLDSAGEELDFEIMTDEEFEQYLESLPKPPQIPSVEERLRMTEDTILFLMDLQMGGDL